MSQDRRPKAWPGLALPVAVLVLGTLVVVSSHRRKGWTESGTIAYEFGFVVVLSALPVIIATLALRRLEPSQLESGRDRGGKRRWRVATLVMAAGGAGMLVGRPLYVFSPPGPVWTSDAAYPLALILIGLAAWHFWRFGLGKLVTIGLLAAGGLQFTLFDVGAAPPAWERGYSGVELVGIWLFCGSAGVVLLGVVWSYLIERPADNAPIGSHPFSDGPAGGITASAEPGIVVDKGQTPPMGLWLASDGLWYPPEPHSDAARPAGRERPRMPWWRRPETSVASVVVALWATGFAVGNLERHQAARETEDDDRGPVVDEEWSISADRAGDGIHDVHMIKTFSPLEESDLQDFGGRLVWPETEIELCGVGIRSVGDGFLQIGDIFNTTQGCDGETRMHQAFDQFGAPQTACVFVRSRGVDDEYCAPLTVD